MLLLIALITTNSVFNTHVHLLPDGTYETHAHPINKSNSDSNQEHEHSTIEMIALESLALFTFTFIAFAVVAPLLRITATNIYLIDAVKSRFIIYSDGRSPPVAIA